MTQPLALVLYEKLLPGTQIVNRLQDLGYRVLTVPSPGELATLAEREKAMLVVADLAARQTQKICDGITDLRRNKSTSHIPVIAFAPEKEQKLQTAARAAGAALVVSEAAILTHLQPLLEQALTIELSD
jgi:CheY-like chemotaxis protein